MPDVAHRPRRLYSECGDCTHPDDLAEGLPDALEALAAQYEDDRRRQRRLASHWRWRRDATSL